MTAYPATFQADAEHGGYIITFPDFPDAITEARDLPHGIKQARKALAEVIAARLDRGESIPEPSPLSEGEVLVHLLFKTIDRIKDKAAELEELNKQLKEKGIAS